MSIIGNGIFLFGSRYIGGSSSLNPDTLTFGTGELGEVTYDTDQEWTCGEDTGLIVKDFETLTINEGVTVKAGTRNRGMVIRVLGDCNIHGTLCNNMAPKILTNMNSLDWTLYPQAVLSATAGAGGDGGAGGDAASADGGNGGTGMLGRFYGGGYGGGGGGGSYYDTSEDGTSYDAYNGGNATDITTEIENIFIGGSDLFPEGSYGGGGAGYGSWGSNGPGSAGNNATSYGGGSGGNGNYGGGVIILMVGGNLTISGTGNINSDGLPGGQGGGGSKNGQYHQNGGGGGGGGGGIIYICHAGYYSNHGSISCQGGAGGEVYSSVGGYPGHPGEAGPEIMIVPYVELESNEGGV